jgi:hypothetical protein
LVIAVACYSFWKFKTRPIAPPFTLDAVESKSSDSLDTLDINPPGSETAQQTPPDSGLRDTDRQAPPSLDATPTQTRPPQTPQVVAPPQSTVAVDFSADARLRALADGNATLALNQGNAFQSSISGTTWTIRLIVACQVESLRYCAQTLAHARPDLFLRPIRLRDGNMCYQLFTGQYPNRNAAEAELRRIRTAFEGGRQVDPRIMQVGDIATAQ